MISSDQLFAALAIVTWTIILWNRRDMKGISIKASHIEKESRKRHQALIAVWMESAAPESPEIKRLAQLVREL